LSEDPTHIDTPRIQLIERIEKETPTVSTILFNDPMCATAEPGQYAMIWVPGVGEVPMSLSLMEPPDRSAITVRVRGGTTEALLNLRQKDQIGIRGPYGRGYTLTEGRTLLIGGGTGIASLIPLAERLTDIGSEIVFISGAERKEELLLLNRISRLEGGKFRLMVTTEDGSLGIKGTPVDPARKLMKKGAFDMIYTCGPELMMREIFDIAEKRRLRLQASLERIIKCGIGLCGHCGIGPYLVCKDGPVFTSDQLREVKDEFGIITRDHSCKIISLRDN
jgi:dihydroorotate dehydrogenase electron transfer subunit